MAELALNDDQRNALARELDGMRVPELMWHEAAPDTGFERGPAQIGSCGGA